MKDEPDRRHTFPMLGLMLGFVPAVFFLTVMQTRNFNPSSSFFAAGAVGTLLCCFFASFLLFRHQTILAVAGGILLLLLNGAIAFFLGCGALLSGIS
jgi:hypothetical protein